MKQKTQKFLKKSSYWLGIIIFGAILGVSLQITKAAWTEPEPGINPPDGNIGAPINISSIAQNKVGSLTTTGGLGTAGSLFVGTKAGIANTSISGDLTLDVEGKVGATAYCDQNGDNCVTPNVLGGNLIITDMGRIPTGDVGPAGPVDLGVHSFCFFYDLTFNRDAAQCRLYKSGDNWYLRTYENARCGAYCADFN